MKTLFAPVLSEDNVAYLHFLIEEHHKAFDLYPSCNIIPKMHYMVHYPSWISRYASLSSSLSICVPYIFDYRCGPLSRFWCMRYESKHNYFKDLALRVKCFKNIPLTLASHHQRLCCLHLTAHSIKENFLIKSTDNGPCKYSNSCVYIPLIVGKGHQHR